MRFLHIFLIAWCLLAGFYTAQVRAQDNVPVITYRGMVEQLYRYESPSFDYTTLKVYYTQTPFYDPLGSETRDKMLRLAYTIQLQDRNEVVDQALAQYTALVRDHIANLTVVNQALALARQDNRLGDPAFYTHVRKKLFNNLLRSGDGLSLRGAYDVVSLDEEKMLLDRLGYTVEQTKAGHEGVVYYNMHYVIDRATNRPYTIFVNITKPMEFLERQQRNKPKSFDTPKR